MVFVITAHAVALRRSCLIAFFLEGAGIEPFTDERRFANRSFSRAILSRLILFAIPAGPGRAITGTLVQTFLLGPGAFLAEALIFSFLRV